MNVIKIFTESQLILLRNINGLLGHYRLPKDMLMYMNYILQDEVLGERGFIAILLDPVMDDTGEIEDAANIYPLEVEFTEEIEHQEIEDTCGISGCPQVESHTHNSCGVSGCTDMGSHTHNSCGVSGCTQTGEHSHGESGGSHHQSGHGKGHH